MIRVRRTVEQKKAIIAEYSAAKSGYQKRGVLNKHGIRAQQVHSWKYNLRLADEKLARTGRVPRKLPANNVKLDAAITIFDLALAGHISRKAAHEAFRGLVK